MTWLPSGLRYQANCAALFTNRQGAWSQACYLVKPQGDAEWSEVPREALSPMWVAGYRQRLDRALTEVRKSKHRADIYKQVARHIAARYAEVFPDQRPITEVKLLNAVWRTDELTMTHPEGRWRVPPAEALDRKHVSTLAHYRLVGTKWTDAATPKKAKTPATKAAPPLAVAAPKNQSPPRALPAGSAKATASAPKAAPPTPVVAGTAKEPSASQTRPGVTARPSIKPGVTPRVVTVPRTVPPLPKGYKPSGPVVPMPQAAAPKINPPPPTAPK